MKIIITVGLFLISNFCISQQIKNQTYINSEINLKENIMSNAVRWENEHQKWTCYNFRVVDSTTYYISQKYPEINDIDSLVNMLTKECKNDLEKVRAIFIWINLNIHYNGFTYKGHSVVHDGIKSFEKREGVCDGQSELFQIMCSKTNIKSYIIVGNVENIYKSDHGWNAVEIDNRIFLIENSWGSISFDYPSRGYAEFYFLANPYFHSVKASGNSYYTYNNQLIKFNEEDKFTKKYFRDCHILSFDIFKNKKNNDINSFDYQHIREVKYRNYPRYAFTFKVPENEIKNKTKPIINKELIYYTSFKNKDTLNFVEIDIKVIHEMDNSTFFKYREDGKPYYKAKLKYLKEIHNQISSKKEIRKINKEIENIKEIVYFFDYGYINVRN